MEEYEKTFAKRQKDRLLASRVSNNDRDAMGEALRKFKPWGQTCCRFTSI